MAEKEYIEREALPGANTNDNDYADGWNECLEAIEAIPAEDVRPVVRGKWTSVFDIGTVCNQCGYDIEEHGYDVRTDGEPNFCPNCGADMRQEPT